MRVPLIAPNGLVLGYLLRPSSILLAGCDSLWAGTPRGQLYRRADGRDLESQVKIDYAREKRLLPKIEAKYGLTISLLPGTS